MLRIKAALAFASLFSSFFVLAQNTPAIEREQWTNSPVIHAIAPGYAKEAAVVISDKRRIEYIDVNNDQVEYRTLHKIVHLNDDHGIEAFNKIYLPVVENKSIVDIKARTILPNGKIIELDVNDIKEIKENDNVYKIFAMEGLTKGCEIEFLYTYNSNLSFFGREVLQGGHQVLKSDVEIVSPARLVFDTRAFNGAATVSTDSLNGKNTIALSMTDLPAADDEKYSMYTANLKRIEYKLLYNKARKATERLFTWNDLAKRIYSMNAEFNEKELKKMNNVVDNNGWRKIDGDRAKVIAVENYFKSSIAVKTDIYSDEAHDIEWILKNKMCSQRGLTRLFSAAFTVLGVNHEHVLCGSRESFVVDKSFENWLNCDNELIFINSLQKYISPASTNMRFPWIDPNWAGTDGVFCKPTTIGSFTTAIAYTKQIKLESMEETQGNIDAHIRLNGSLDTLLIDAKNINSGYLSAAFRSLFNYNSPEDQQQIIKSMVKNNFGTEKIISTKIENKEFEGFNDNKPVILEMALQAPGMIENAGNRILVKVGELIGPQVEMYQEKERMFPIEISFPHVLARKITMEIPSGYKVGNLDDLKISKVVKEEDKVTMGFESSVELTGNIVTITIFEQYGKIRYPIAQYDQFKDIINAAADFNKLVLVLEKT